MAEISKACILRASQSYDRPCVIELDDVFSGEEVKLNDVIAESLDHKLIDGRKRLIKITIDIQVLDKMD